MHFNALNRPTENIGPRRLRFRRGRVVYENSNGEVVKRIIRRNKDDIKASGSVAHANSSEASAVTLMHQDAQEKKNMQALFNHVIEETARKLVETRKSKVKALVGAFETVISLQENKATQRCSFLTTSMEVKDEHNGRNCSGPCFFAFLRKSSDLKRLQGV